VTSAESLSSIFIELLLARLCRCFQRANSPTEASKKRSAHMRMLLTLLVAITLACAAASAVIIGAPGTHYAGGYADGES